MTVKPIISPGISCSFNSLMKKKLVRIFGRDDDKLIHVVAMYFTVFLAIIYSIVLAFIN